MQKPGLGQRLVERIKAKGYGDPHAKFGIKVTEFALDHRYPPGHVYKWIGDVVVPDYETILRLARDLDATPGWLHYGDPPQVETPPLQRKAPTKSRGRRGRGATLCPVRGRTVAHTLLSPAMTAASGSRSRAA